MGDEHLLEDRDGVRTPMQWEASPTAGFSTAGPQDLYLPVVSSPEYSPAAVNVAAQRDDPGSLLLWTREMLTIRADLPTMGAGAFHQQRPWSRRRGPRSTGRRSRSIPTAGDGFGRISASLRPRTRSDNPKWRLTESRRRHRCEVHGLIKTSDLTSPAVAFRS